MIVMIKVQYIYIVTNNYDYNLYLSPLGSQSVTFSGNSFIQYQIAGSSSRRRAARQAPVHYTGRDYVSLAFATSSDSGTLLLLGVDNNDNDYAILEVHVLLYVCDTLSDKYWHWYAILLKARYFNP